MTTEILENLQRAAIEEALKAYPEKAGKDRAKHLGVDLPEGVKGACDSIKSNKQTVPGVMSQRAVHTLEAKALFGDP
ncbi:MAG: hypothetical protein LBB59_03010 [Campylobacteraceae bacterium]|jgi:nitrogenase molybdenum-iron protein alpha chain|nr:hypothetical protein [Campylobacteraceae bacterium]